MTLSVSNDMNIALLAIVAAVFALGLRKFDALPSSLRDRSCQGKSWHLAFPHASKAQIRDFLTTFVDAFAYRKKDQLKFRPDDVVLNIYGTRYSHPWQADAMELETLARSLQEKYAVQMENIWHEQITLGEVFSECMRSAARSS